MDATLQALGGILLKAVPTVFIVLFLHFYIKKVFFGPIEKVLAERYQATEGARKSARESLDRANAHAADYESKMMAARGEIYKQQDEIRKQWRTEQDQAVHEMRARTAGQVKRAKDEIAIEAAAARHSLQTSSEALAEQITSRVLRGNLN